MFGKKMNLDMEKYVGRGLCLNLEESLVLQVSLAALQAENHFRTVSFYGKILGTDSDYYIAYGVGEDSIRNKMFFYSVDGRFWQLLFPPSERDLSDFRFTRNRFTGDPTHVHRFHLGEKKVVLREDVRLSAAVNLLHWETAIGPKGALQIDPRTGFVKENPYFEGLEDATDISSYVHHRLPLDRVSFRATDRLCSSAGDAALEFLEPIKEDYPPGCWMLRDDPVSGVVRLHSLWWPGHSFCYCKATGRYHSMYVGLGDRNDDLPFML